MRLILFLLFTSITFSQINYDLEIIDINIKYDEGALYVMWDDTSDIIDYYHIFYCEGQDTNLIRNVLFHGATWSEVWEWEIGINMYPYFYVNPQSIFPTNTSWIQIGIMAKDWNGDKSILFLAPWVLNSRPGIVDVNIRESN